MTPFFRCESIASISLLRLWSNHYTNNLTGECVLALTTAIRGLDPRPLIITGNAKFFSAGADLHEIAGLTGSDAYEFSRMGQRLMNAVANFPAPVYAAILGYCMGGGLDLALACHYRIAHPHAVFGHRGAALGLITGWGGTQRLPRVLGKAKALEMFVSAEKLHAAQALRIVLVDMVAEDPIAAVLGGIHRGDIEAQRKT